MNIKKSKYFLTLILFDINRYNSRMASSKEYLDFVLEQLSALPDIDYRAMMGEYIIYYHG